MERVGKSGIHGFLLLLLRLILLLTKLPYMRRTSARPPHLATSSNRAMACRGLALSASIKTATRCGNCGCGDAGPAAVVANGGVDNAHSSSATAGPTTVVSLPVGVEKEGRMLPSEKVLDELVVVVVVAAAAAPPLSGSMPTNHVVLHFFFCTVLLAVAVVTAAAAAAARPPWIISMVIAGRRNPSPTMLQTHIGSAKDPKMRRSGLKRPTTRKNHKAKPTNMP
jgi:hypothetical protein